MNELIDKLNLIFEDELINRNINIIIGDDQAEIVVGSKSIDGIPPFIKRPENYNISTKNIVLFLKLYQKVDPDEKEIILNNIYKIFDQSNEYYNSLCYFAFSISFLLDKDRALNMLKDYFVLNKNYSLTIHILNLILTYKHEYFMDSDLETVKKLVNIIISKIRSYGRSRLAPDFINSKAKRVFFTDGWSSQRDVLVKGLFPRTLKRIHEIKYNRFSKVLDDINPEINKDRIKLIAKIEELKFPPEAQECLEKVDRIYFGNPDEFDLKSCLGHLRSFFEEIIYELKNKIQNISNIDYCGEPKKFNKLINYLKKVDFINEDEVNLFQKFSNLISNEGVHSFTSKREYVRICKNVVIEFALLLLERYSTFESNKKAENVIK